MAHHVIISNETLEKLGQLARLLERAGKMAREISQARTFVPEIPDLTRPAHVPKDEEWFWTETWQAGEREVNKELAEGRFVVFDNVEVAIRWLKS